MLLITWTRCDYYLYIWESEVGWRNLSKYIISTISDKVAISSPYFSFRSSFKWKFVGWEWDITSGLSDRCISIFNIHATPWRPPENGQKLQTTFMGRPEKFRLFNLLSNSNRQFSSLRKFFSHSSRNSSAFRSLIFSLLSRIIVASSSSCVYV